jgi:hypothetical protein
MIGIYQIISPSGKIYIGQSINIEQRKLQYLRLNRSCIGPKLYNSIKKPILQYDLEDNLIKEWDGFIDVKLELNYDQSTIRKCCKNLQKTAYNFKWKYKKISYD